MDEAVEQFTELHESLLREEANAEKAELEELLQTLSLRELADVGVAVPRLVITDVSSGLYGRTVVTFTSKRSALQRLHGNGPTKPPAEQLQHRLSPGDIVGLFRYDRPITGSSSAIATGVVHKIHVAGVSVAFEEQDGETWVQEHHPSSGESLGLVYNLLLVSSEVTINRQRNALRTLREGAFESPARRIVAVCFGGAGPQFLQLQLAVSMSKGGISRPREMDAFASEAADRSATLRSWKDVELSSEELQKGCLWRGWFCDTLTESQRRAVFLGLMSQDVALIHGPPGTGKTTTVVEVLLQLVAAGFRVLACAPSNIAVDNMLERCYAVAKGLQDTQLLQQVKRCVRIGHPARIDEQLVGFCLDRQHLNSDSSGIIRGLKASLDESLRELSAMKRRTNQQQQDGGGGSAKREMRAEARRLMQDMKVLQRKSVMEALQSAPIVFATCAGAADASLQRLVKGRERTSGEPEQAGLPFDVVVIDEAAQVIFVEL
ncbi:r3h domain-containing protein [Cyclospora cayetanensis]|uniref:DNA helicase n=1 Tax=Cyclospora cayetanensis TaxID=88456 RepID=A0A1D3CRV0_9EIME|nr:r3h domain-containing protein [Cyclospora cayetanensis]